MTTTTLQLVAVPDAESSARPDARWEALIAEHDRKVALSLLARGARLNEARDVSHEAWARLFEQHVTGRLPRLELPGLAIAQAGFLWAERLRQRARPLEPIDAPEAVSVVDPQASVERRLLSRDELSRARQALEGCGRRAREVFTLAYEHPELPHAEIARKVGLSLQRVRQTLCEVRAKLRAALEEDVHE